VTRATWPTAEAVKTVLVRPSMPVALLAGATPPPTAEKAMLAPAMGTGGLLVAFCRKAVTVLVAAPLAGRRVEEADSVRM
jgi:hypothetical protein